MNVKEWKSMPRGMRNNNPLNIRRGKKPWVGEQPYIRVVDNNGEMEQELKYYDRTFCQFACLTQGFRAAFILLKKYIVKYDLNTIEEVIRRWAPENENNTKHYIDMVATRSLIDRKEKLDFYNKLQMVNIVNAMVMVECGAKWEPLIDDNRLLAMSDGYELAKDYPVC